MLCYNFAFFFFENLVCISVATLECVPLYIFFFKPILFRERGNIRYYEIEENGVRAKEEVAFLKRAHTKTRKRGGVVTHLYHCIPMVHSNPVFAHLPPFLFSFLFDNLLGLVPFRTAFITQKKNSQEKRPLILDFDKMFGIM